MWIFRQKCKARLFLFGLGTGIFLVDESLYAARPDLVLTGRTLMGHESAKINNWKITISGLYLHE